MTMTRPTSEQITFTGAGVGAQQRLLVDKLGDIISVKDFGAVGNGVADDTAAIQAAIDWCVYKNLPSNTFPDANGIVYFPSGKYRITNTIQMCYGDTFRSISLLGAGMRYRGETTFCGTAIIADFNDRPAIAVNAGRNILIEQISINGKNRAWGQNNLLGNPDVLPLVDDLVASNWVDPSFPASASSRYAPYAGIAVDPYAGTRPASPNASYPDVNFPGWLNYNTQYLKPGTSNVMIRDVEISGFVVGVVIQPSGFDTLGDFIRINDCHIEYCQYGISWGNTQCRELSVDNCQMQFNYCCLTTTTHGRQLGKPLVCVRNTCWNFSIIGVIMQNMNVSSNVSFTNVYSEALYQIADFGGAGAGMQSVGFYECEFNLDLWNTRGIPLSPFTFVADGGATFVGCKFYTRQANNEPTLIYFNCNASQLSMINCFFYAGERASTLYEKVASNATMGMVVGLCETELANWSVKQLKAYDVTTGNQIPSNGRSANENHTGWFARQTGLPIYAKRLVPGLGSGAPPLQFSAGSYPVNLTLAASVSQTGDTVTFDLTGAVAADVFLFQMGGNVGDVAVHSVTRTAFVVAAKTGLTLTLKAVNNLDANGDLAVTISLTGTMYFANCRIYTLNLPHWGDTSTSSAVISNVKQLDGASSNVNSATLGVQAGDALYTGSGQYRGFFSPTNAVITSVGTDSITMTGNARFNLTRERMDFFVRQPTPNNT